MQSKRIRIWHFEVIKNHSYPAPLTRANWSSVVFQHPKLHDNFLVLSNNAFMRSWNSISSVLQCKYFQPAWFVCFCFFPFFCRADIDTRRAMESLTEHMTASLRQDSVSCGCVFHCQYFKCAFWLCECVKKSGGIQNLRPSHHKFWWMKAAV